MQQTRNEVIETFERFGVYEKDIIVLSKETDEVEKLCWFLRTGSLIPFDGPDAYIQIDKEVLIIEHFRIDGYEVFPNGGSILMSNEKLHERIPYIRNGNVSTRYRQINTINSYERFIDNTKARFEKHYTQINQYKERLISTGIAEENTIFTVCFLMDDASPIGTLTSNGEKTVPVCLGKSVEFLSFFKEKTMVDWILSAVAIGSENKPYFFSRKEIDDCLLRAENYANYQFLGSNTQYIDFRFEE